jgi:archaellum component FlaF (FlaF/FlaG flagellin family)
LAIGYLYVDIKLSNKEIQEGQNKKIELLEVKVDQLTLQLRKSDSDLSAATSKIKVLQELGKIK